MSIIQLDVSDIVSLKGRILRMLDRLDECCRDVHKTASAIDMKVSKRKDIDTDLQRIEADLKKQTAFLQQCARLIGEAVNGFADAEKINRLPDLSVSLNNTGVSAADVSAHSAVNDLIVEAGLLSSAEASDLFSRIKSGLGPLILADHPEIAEYVKLICSGAKDANRT